jgi:hypothetical protein
MKDARTPKLSLAYNNHRVFATVNNKISIFENNHSNCSIPFELRRLEDYNILYPLSAYDDYFLTEFYI